MRAYRFRLATVLRVRELQLLAARQEVSAAARSLAEGIERERRVTRAYEELTAAVGPQEADAFRAERECGARLALMMQAAARERQGLAERLLEARSEAVSADRRVSVLNRLAERRRNQWLSGVQHEDVALLDDFSGVRAAAAMMEVSLER